jgi:hypothetical protein
MNFPLKLSSSSIHRFLITSLVSFQSTTKYLAMWAEYFSVHQTQPYQLEKYEFFDVDGTLLRRISIQLKIHMKVIKLL